MTETPNPVRDGSRGHQEWETPRALFDALDSDFLFTIDAAASDENALLHRYWTEEVDALQQSWEGERLFANPPFRLAKRFAEKAARCEAACAVLLIPASVDTKWWDDHVVGAAANVWFVKGRIRFNQGGEPGEYVLPMPMAVVVWTGTGLGHPIVRWGWTWPGRTGSGWADE